MKRGKDTGKDSLWTAHDRAWRAPAAVSAGWKEAEELNPRSLRRVVRGAFWDLLTEHRITLLVSREYEHLLLGLGTNGEKPLETYFALPHPSGISVNSEREEILTASTRNPNQIFSFRPVDAYEPRRELGRSTIRHRALFPVRVDLYPGYLYLHDIAVVNGKLLGASAGQNAVVELRGEGEFEPIWWPRCVERRGKPVLERNHLQLNSIAAGASLSDSYFCASASEMTARRPGHRNFPVDRRGVVFSGRTREPIASGLTRPHSIRLHRDEVWVNNSGYGEVGVIKGGQFDSVARLPGWTRGLAFSRNVAFVGVSRILPRFKQYAPGLQTVPGECGIYAVDVRTGSVLGSVVWPEGNQIFAIEAVPQRFTQGYPFVVGRRAGDTERKSFYSFRTGNKRGVGR